VHGFGRWALHRQYNQTAQQHPAQQQGSMYNIVHPDHPAVCTAQTHCHTPPSSRPRCTISYIQSFLRCVLPNTTPHSPPVTVLPEKQHQRWFSTLELLARTPLLFDVKRAPDSFSYQKLTSGTWRCRRQAAVPFCRRSARWTFGDRLSPAARCYRERTVGSGNPETPARTSQPHVSPQNVLGL
jgi:hypothetical protein